MTDSTGQPIPDFSANIEPIRFTCDGRTYQVPRVIATVNLATISEVTQHTAFTDPAWFNTHIREAIPELARLFEALVPGDGGKYLAARIRTDGADPDLLPLDLAKQGMPIATYLLEELGLRPTVPSSPSSDGSTAEAQDTTSDAISSTDGVSAEG